MHFRLTKRLIPASSCGLLVMVTNDPDQPRIASGLTDSHSQLL
jgi:hypothetical protein